MKKTNRIDKISNVCIIEKVGQDKKGRPILEFGGDKKKCADVISALVDKRGIVIQIEDDEK